MLVAGIAHEVNSPAAAVQGLVDALQETVRRLEPVRARPLRARAAARVGARATSSWSTAWCPR